MKTIVLLITFFCSSFVNCQQDERQLSILSQSSGLSRQSALELRIREEERQLSQSNLSRQSALGLLMLEGEDHKTRFQIERQRFEEDTNFQKATVVTYRELLRLYVSAEDPIVKDLIARIARGEGVRVLYGSKYYREQRDYKRKKYRLDIKFLEELLQERSITLNDFMKAMESDKSDAATKFYEAFNLQDAITFKYIFYGATENLFARNRDVILPLDYSLKYMIAEPLVDVFQEDEEEYKEYEEDEEKYKETSLLKDVVTEKYRSSNRWSNWSYKFFRKLGDFLYSGLVFDESLNMLRTLRYQRKADRKPEEERIKKSLGELSFADLFDSDEPILFNLLVKKINISPRKLQFLINRLVVMAKNSYPLEELVTILNQNQLRFYSKRYYDIRFDNHHLSNRDAVPDLLNLFELFSRVEAKSANDEVIKNLLSKIIYLRCKKLLEKKSVALDPKFTQLLSRPLSDMRFLTSKLPHNILPFIKTFPMYLNPTPVFAVTSDQEGQAGYFFSGVFCKEENKEKKEKGFTKESYFKDYIDLGVDAERRKANEKVSIDASIEKLLLDLRNGNLPLIPQIVLPELHGEKPLSNGIVPYNYVFNNFSSLYPCATVPCLIYAYLEPFVPSAVRDVPSAVRDLLPFVPASVKKETTGLQREKLTLPYFKVTYFSCQIERQGDKTKPVVLKFNRSGINAPGFFLYHVAQRIAS